MSFDIINQVEKEIKKVDDVTNKLDKAHRKMYAEYMVNKYELFGMIETTLKKINIFYTDDEIKDFSDMLKNYKFIEYVKKMYKGLALSDNDIFRLFETFTFYYYPDMIRGINKSQYPYGPFGLGNKISLTNDSDYMIKNYDFKIENNLPKITEFEDNSLVEVIRFEKHDYKFVLNDPGDSRYGKFHPIFWAINGIYYYPCRGSGIFLKSNKFMIGFNKLHVLSQLGFDLANAIINKTLGKTTIPKLNQISIPAMCASKPNDFKLCEEIKEGFDNFADRCEYLKNQVDSFGKFENYFNIKQKIEECKKKFANETDWKKKKDEIKKCYTPILEKYIEAIEGAELIKYFNLSDSDKMGEKGTELKNNYGKIYDANWNQIALDTTIFNLAKEKGYDHILVTHEPTDKEGIFGFEIIDLKEIPLRSTINLRRYDQLPSLDKLKVDNMIKNRIK